MHHQLIRMKNKLFILASIVALWACKKEYNLSTSTVIPSTVRNINTMMTTGNWRIRQYWNVDHDETVQFRGYIFNFGVNKVITASRRGSTVTGSWSAGEVDSKNKLVFDFTTPDIFVEISNTWEVTDMTDNTLRLQVSRLNGETDWIKMEKN
jgi:hypothetical protein